MVNYQFYSLRLLSIYTFLRVHALLLREHALVFPWPRIIIAWARVIIIAWPRIGHCVGTH